jgi:hypothetical protein
MENLVLEMQHRMNPLHVHCRLVERGLGKSSSIAMCRTYESLVFGWLNGLTVLVILLCQAKR